MALERDGGLVDFDVDAVLEAVSDAAGEDGFLVCVVYDDDSFSTVHVDERVDALYPDAETREEHFARIHSYVHLDFTERELFEDLFIDSGGARAFVTYMGNVVAVRVLSGDQGAFLVLAPDVPVTDVVEAAERAMGAGTDA